MGRESSIVVSYKLSYWKQYIVRRFFPDLSKNFNTIDNIYSLLKGKKATLLVWGTTLEDENIKIENDSIKVIRIEDGFIRSVGLGVRLTVPISLVADPVGIYYNSTAPSLLENILLYRKISNSLLERADNLISVIREKKLTKYNLNEKKWIPPRTDKKIIVVPGQVESDKSIRYGSPFIKTNIELLKQVRKRNPKEYIVYKPHPDVAKGFRNGSYSEKVLKSYCDEICINCSTHSLIEGADEIHTITSLFGFEGLIMGKKIFCYGQPFYSGYGLTIDLYPNERRNKNISIQQLIAAALIVYPMYVSLVTDKKISVEEAVNELISFKEGKIPFKWKLWSLFQNLLEPFIKLKKW